MGNFRESKVKKYSKIWYFQNNQENKKQKYGKKNVQIILFIPFINLL